MFKDSVSSNRKHLVSWSGSIKLPLITLVVILKITGFVSLVIFFTLSLAIKTKPQILSYKIPAPQFGRANRVTQSNIVIPNQVLMTAEASFSTPTNSNFPVEPTAPILIESTLIPTQTITLQFSPTTTASKTNTMTPTPSNTPTRTPTPTATPILAVYDSKMNTPIQGVGLEELKLIISQKFNVPNIKQDSGHHGVDLGSYDFKGKNLSGDPIHSVFSGKVAGMTTDRPPLGNNIIIETPYDLIPVELSTRYNVVPGQSLYQLYGHMLEAPVFQIGDKINGGQRIGRIGKSQTAEAHLHLEFRIGPSDQTFAGMAYYSTDATQMEKDTYLRWRISGQFIPYDPMGWLEIGKP